MIENHFSFMQGICEKTERRLNELGIACWDDFLGSAMIKGFSRKRKLYYDRLLRRTRKAIYEGDCAYLHDNIPYNMHWMLYGFFREESVMIDIEVTGVRKNDYVFMVGLSDSYSTMTMVKGMNLDMRKLEGLLRNYSMLISFNGSVHDVPFLKRRYPGLFPRIPHVDLRFLCSKIGLKGGLKDIEAELGIGRQPLINNMRSGDVVRLWRIFRSSEDPYYLKLLMQYNEDDVVNLERIFPVVLSRLQHIEKGYV